MHQYLAKKTLLMPAAWMFLLLPVIFSQADAQANRETPKSPQTMLRVEVITSEESQPIEGAGPPQKTIRPVSNAHVRVESLSGDNKFERDVVTDSKGIATIPNVPRGEVRIQVTARGFEPAGERRKLDQEKQIVKFELRRNH